MAVADFTGICANTTFVIETKDASVLLSEYLPFVMQTEAFHVHSIQQSEGSVNPYVNFPCKFPVQVLLGIISICRRPAPYLGFSIGVLGKRALECTKFPVNFPVGRGKS